MEINGGVGRKVTSAGIVIEAFKDYLPSTKLWSSSAKAHRLPEQPTIIYHQNSIVMPERGSDVWDGCRFYCAQPYLPRGSTTRSGGRKTRKLRPGIASALSSKRLRNGSDKMSCQRNKE